MQPLLALLSLLAGDPFVRTSLPGGAELLVLEAPAAPGTSVFVALPHGLLADRPGRAQEAHLLEHYLIRGCEPDALEVDGLRINGETGCCVLRLEVLAPAGGWREALARPARWLGTRAIDAAVLARERQRIGAEEASTLGNGFTHKWALAAWSQVVLGGRARANVHGDVLEASAAELGLRAGLLARLGPGARIVVAGPVEAAQVLELVRKEYAAFLDQAATAPSAPVAPACRAYAAEWDLAAEHDLVWVALPAKEPEELAAAWVLEQAARTRLAQAGSGLLGPGRAQAELVVLPGTGRALLLSAGGFEKARAPEVRKLLEGVCEALARMDGGKSWNATLAQCRMQLGPAPDFGAQRAQLAGNPFAAWIEGQYALDLLGLELRTGVPVARLPGLLEKDAGARAARLATACADATRRGSLRLSAVR